MTNSLGVIFAEQGKFPEAERFMRRTLAASERAFGEVSEFTLLWTKELAFVLQAQGKRAEAAKTLRKAAKISRRSSA